MTYAMSSAWLPPPVFISVWSRDGAGWIDLNPTYISATSGTWPLTNRTIYTPIYLSAPVIAKRLWVLNGATVGTNTWTIAIYASDSAGLPSTRLVSSSAATAGANACQFFDITDTALDERRYFVGLALSGMTDTAFRNAPSVEHARRFIFTENSNCPATATPVQAASGFVPVCGIALRASP